MIVNNKVYTNLFYVYGLLEDVQDDNLFIYKRYLIMFCL